MHTYIRNLTIFEKVRFHRGYACMPDSVCFALGGSSTDPTRCSRKGIHTPHAYPNEVQHIDSKSISCSTRNQDSLSPVQKRCTIPVAFKSLFWSQTVTHHVALSTALLSRRCFNTTTNTNRVEGRAKGMRWDWRITMSASYCVVFWPCLVQRRLACFASLAVGLFSSSCWVLLLVVAFVACPLFTPPTVATVW
jgi:hypothetical protein